MRAQNTKPCKVEGCNHNALARNMCRNHYRSWMARMQRRGLQVKRATIVDQLQDVLPATRKQIAERLGVTLRAVLVAIPKAYEQGLIHVSGYEQPGPQGHWSAILAWGEGKDAVLDLQACANYRAERKRKHSRDYKLRKKNEAQSAKPTSFAALLAPLGA